MMTLNKEIILDTLSGPHVITSFFKMKERVRRRGQSDMKSEDLDLLLHIWETKKEDHLPKYVCGFWNLKRVSN